MDGQNDRRGHTKLGPTARSEAELRRERQAKALRENLKRRKQRDRGPEEAGTKSDG